MAEYTFRTVLPFDGSAPRIEPELEQNELAAIGFVAVQWSYLEHAILASTYRLAAENDLPVPTCATSPAFTKRLRAWRLMIEQVASALERDQLLKIVSKIANLEDKRHKVAHGMWTWDQANPQRLRAYSRRPPFIFEVKFDFEGLIKLATTIGELTFQITYPGGKDDAMLSFADIVSEHGSYVSRSFRLAAMEKAPSSPRPRPTTPPKRKRPRQSSKD